MGHHFTKTSPTKKKIKRHLGSKHEGTGVEQGQHTVEVVGITNAEWSKKELIVGETIDANVETFGFKDGVEIIFEIYETDPNSPDKMRDSIPKKINGNKAKLTWKYPENIVPKNKASSQYSVSSIYFMVFVQDESSMSGEIPVYSDLNIKVEKEDGTPIPQVEIVLNQSDGKISFHNTDSSGMVSVKKLPPRNQTIKFTGSARIVPDGEKVVDFSSAPQERNIVALGNKIHVFKLIELYMYCSHTIEWEGKVISGESIEKKRRSVCNTNVFEVVPDYKGNDKYEDKVMILSRTAKSLQANGKDLEKTNNEFGMQAFLLKCEQDFNNAIPNIFSAEFWKGLAKPKEYKIAGLPTPLTVKCYRPDFFKLQIKMPAIGSWSGGWVVQAGVKNVVSHIKNKEPIKKEKYPLPKEKGWDSKHWPEKIPSDKAVILQRNGVSVDTKVLDYIMAFIALSNQISKIVSFIQDNVPQVGFYFKWKCEVLQGTFVLDWGWKEYKDYRAYYYFGFNLDVKLIEVNAEFGVGVSGFSFKVQIFIALNGSIAISAKVSRYSPEGDPEFAIPFGGDIIGKAGARAQAGCFITLEGTIETGLKAEDGSLKWRMAEGVSASCTIKFAGLTGKFKISGGTAKKEGTDEMESVAPNDSEEKVGDEYEWELVKSSELYRFEWSKDHHEEYIPATMPAEKLHDMTIKKLKVAKIKIIINKSSSWYQSDTVMEREKVAQAIETKIHERNDIRKDPKSIEALLFEIVNTLDQMSNDGQVWESDFNHFLNGKSWATMMQHYIDPIQEIIEKSK